MRNRTIDRGYFVVLVLTVLVIWPFLRTASLPHDTDAELHIFRLAELARMWEGGVFYPRWATNFYYGYGYPIFNFYAPLTYYVGLVFMLVPGVGAVMASKLVLMLGLVGAAIGMYGFVRDRFGRTSGMVAAASYIYAPYLVYIDPHGRGVLPESFSFCVFPLALWSLDRLLRQPSARRFITTCLLIAAVILTHNLMAMIFGGLLFGYFLWAVLLEGSGQGARSRGTAFLVFPIGVTAAAFFWLPMVLEQDAIQIATVIGEGSHYDYRNHFLSLGEMLAIVQRFDWGASEPYYLRSLGVVQWVLGVAGFGRILLTRFHNRRTATFFAIFSLMLAALMLPISQTIWQTIPLLPFLQFPWRLLGATNAMLAVAGAVLFAKSGPPDREEVPIFSNRYAATVVLLIVLFALPLLQVKPWPAFGGTAASDVLDSELAGRWRGTTSTADFVPATVDVSPRPQQAVVEQIAANQLIDPVNRGALGSAVVETEVLTPVHYRLEVASPDPFVLRFFIFDFPGWVATVDGVSAEIELATPDGFITVPLEKGRHTVELKFGTTPVRSASWWLSGGALLLMAIVAVFLSRSAAETSNSVSQDQFKPRALMLAFGAMTLFAIVVVEPAGWLRYESQGRNVPVARVNEPDVLFEDKIELIGFDVPTAIEPGRSYDVVPFWRAVSPLERNYQVFVHLISAENGLIAQSDKLNPGDFPTKQWTLDEYVRDPHTLTVPDNLPPGYYAIHVGLWNSETNLRLQTVTTPQNDSFVLQEFTVEK